MSSKLSLAYRIAYVYRKGAGSLRNVNVIGEDSVINLYLRMTFFFFHISKINMLLRSFVGPEKEAILFSGVQLSHGLLFSSICNITTLMRQAQTTHVVLEKAFIL